MPKEPLTIKEQDTLLEAAKKYGDYQRWEGSEDKLDTYKAIAFMLDTACHPSVLSDEKHQLRTVKEKGKIYIEWNRPKKKGHDAFTRIRASKRLVEWVEEFVALDKPGYRQFYNHMLKAVAETIKKPSRGLQKENLSPLAIRHTFAVNMLDRGVDAEAVRQMMNCSRKTLEFYSKYRRDMLESKLDDIDW
tara:strand:- start:549 stop:1118 length:570 start_codon:yes stop_codon:yes gene_type:complete